MKNEDYQNILQPIILNVSTLMTRPKLIHSRLFKKVEITKAKTLSEVHQGEHISMKRV